MRNSIVYGGRSLGEFGLSLIDGSASFVSPEKEYEVVSIPGRNGDLSIFNKFSDVEISIPCYIHRNFVENYRNLLQFLNSVDGYQRFEISNDPDHFRKALFLGAVVPKTGPFNFNGRFSLRFRMNPQRWLKWAEEWIDATSSFHTWDIDNSTNMSAKPLIQFQGNGTITFYGADETLIGSITVANNDNTYVEIDCETFDCYSVDRGIITNRNADVTFNGDPELVPGTNEVVYSSTFEGDEVLKIMPRFFVI